MKILFIALLASVIFASCGGGYKCYPSKKSRDYAKLIEIIKPNRDRYALVFLYKNDSLRIPFAGWSRGKPSKGWVIGNYYSI